jgi:nucleoside-triphosphatase
MRPPTKYNMHMHCDSGWIRLDRHRRAAGSSRPSSSLWASPNHHHRRTRNATLRTAWCTAWCTCLVYCLVWLRVRLQPHMYVSHRYIETQTCACGFGFPERRGNHRRTNLSILHMPGQKRGRAKAQSDETVGHDLHDNPRGSCLPSTSGARKTGVTWLLCTGQPGSGKTTLVRSLWTTLAAECDVHLTGFITEEVLDAAGGRVGFDVLTVPDGRRGVLSRKHGLPASYPKTGSYSVDVASFESLALPSLECPPASGEGHQKIQKKTVVIVDEIGRMELHSDGFKRAIESLLQRPCDGSLFVVGALTAPIYGHRVAFCDEVSAHSRVSVRRITKKTRDEVRQTMRREALVALMHGV